MGTEAIIRLGHARADWVTVAQFPGGGARVVGGLGRGVPVAAAGKLSGDREAGRSSSGGGGQAEGAVEAAGGGWASRRWCSGVCRGSGEPAGTGGGWGPAGSYGGWKEPAGGARGRAAGGRTDMSEDDLLVAEGAAVIMEEEMVESNVEKPSTSLQTDLPIAKRKGKESEINERDEEPMVQTHASQISPATKRRRSKRKTHATKPQVETIPVTTPKVYVRRKRSRTQKACPTGDSTEAISVETSEEGSPGEVEI
ncbi:uncharacterized protein LOC131873975 [Cryptomeria japonica]|uniref:uncharacterized protein LOC131873975 n=1 Tax=Cryptomeria japonica TaxID=3369 RepID=UPI0027D9E88F|nr:uncharacterized protein LOC131873975 [Cryptomeria japonica]